MSTTTLRGPDHHCDPGRPRDGVIVRCDDCGSLWLGRTYPNRQYNHWRYLTRLEAWLRGVRAVRR